NARKFFTLLESFFELDPRRNVFKHDDRTCLLVRDRTERCDRDVKYQRFPMSIARVELVRVADFGQVPACAAKNAFEIQSKTFVKDLIDQLADGLMAGKAHHLLKRRSASSNTAFFIDG